MEPNAKYTFVGAVTLLLVALIVSAILWLSKSKGGAETTHYTIYFKEASLSGLQVDGSVTMRGIKVGRVADLEISKSDIQRVRVNIELDGETPVKLDTQAVIRRNLLTGLAAIDLADSTQESGLLTAVLPGERHPVIPEGVTDMEAIQKTLPELLDAANVLLGKASLFLSDENRTKVDGILANIETITSAISSKNADIEAIIADLSKVVNGAKGLSDALETGIKGGASISGSLANLAESLTRAAKSMSATLDKFDNPKSILVGPQNSDLGPGERR